MSARFERLFRFPRRSRQDLAEAVDEELAFHLEMRAADLIRAGLDEETARRRAREEFGDLESTRRYCLGLDERQERKVQLREWLSEWRHDLRQAWRSLWRNPGFTLVALLTLALAIGANTAIFSAIRSILLRPLPYGHPEGLVSLTETDPANPSARNPLSAPNLFDYRAGQRLLTGIAGYDTRSVTWRPESGDPELLDVVSVTGNMFEVLEVKPLLGTGLSPADDEPGREPRAILSWGLWQRAFGGDPAIVGRVLILNDLSYRVIAVMPLGFSIAGNEAMWTPLSFARERADPAVARRQYYVKAIARLAPGASLTAAGEDLARISRELEAQYPDANIGHRAVLTPLHQSLTSRVRGSLWLLQAASGLLLLIACVNLANLTLARGSTRRREMALRAALGAGRLRLMRQLLAESLGIALVGGMIGVGVSVGLTRILPRLQPQAVPALFPIAPDQFVLLFGLGLSLLTGFGFGLLPAFRAARPDLRNALQEGGRHAAGPGGSGPLRRMLVVAQVALAVVLLAGAGLMLRSFAELIQVPLGFAPDHVLTGEVRVSGERYDPPEAVNGFYDRVLDDLKNRPGVVAVGATMKLPAGGMASSSLTIEGQPGDPNRRPAVGLVLIRGDYLQALRVPLMEGRLFGPEDRSGPGGVLVNQAAARTFFPGSSPVGRRIRLGPYPDAPWSTILGVVGDMREQGFEQDPTPVVYADHGQNTWWRSLTITIRTSGNPAGAEPFLREAVRQADPALALRNVQTLETVLSSNLGARRFALSLVTGFALVALVLAAVGIYGVLAFTVSSRTREFGVRLALGAERRAVLLLVLRQGLGWAVAGLLLGLAGALAGGRLLEGRLYGVTPSDSLTLALVGGTLLLVAALACIVPAARATRVDPVASLRQD